MEIFHYGLFLITFIPKTEPIVHVNCITKLKRMPWHMYLLFVTLFCNTIDGDGLQPNTEFNENCSVWLMWDFNYVVSLQVFRSLKESVACEQCSTFFFFPLLVLLEKTHWASQYFLSISLPWLKAGCMCVDHDVMPRSTDAAQKKNWWKLIGFHPPNPFTVVSLGELWTSHCLQTPLPWKFGSQNIT